MGRMAMCSVGEWDRIWSAEAGGIGLTTSDQVQIG